MDSKHFFARQLRNDATPSEKLLWQRLRSNQMQGLKFRRQFVIKPYIVDFYCHEKQLIIEIDGDTHCLPGADKSDQQRQAYLENMGYRIIRFSSLEVVHNIENVLEAIVRTINYPTQSA